MKINKKIAISETGFLFDSSTGDSFSLNPTGAEILEFIKSGMTENEIKIKLSEMYEADMPLIEKTLSEFISTLKSFKIIND